MFWYLATAGRQEWPNWTVVRHSSTCRAHPRQTENSTAEVTVREAVSKTKVVPTDVSGRCVGRSFGEHVEEPLAVMVMVVASVVAVVVSYECVSASVEVGVMCVWRGDVRYTKEHAMRWPSGKLVRSTDLSAFLPSAALGCLTGARTRRLPRIRVVRVARVNKHLLSSKLRHASSRCPWCRKCLWNTRVSVNITHKDGKVPWQCRAAPTDSV